MIAKPDRAKYKTKQVENDSKIDAKTTEEIAEFWKRSLNYIHQLLKRGVLC